jgi:UDP-N-acetylglucosamine acyltransferase
VIDERAIVDSSVVVGDNVSIGPWTIIGPDVVLGDNVQIASSVVVKGPCHIGAGVKIYQFATVGEDTPALAYAGEDSELTIGANTIIREGVTIHRGMAAGGISRTAIGANCLLMAYVHVGHDCIVGNNVIMANNASLAGHVVVGDYANFGGYAGIPQFRQIGAYTHIAGMSLVTKDVPAFMTVAGNPASAIGLNLEGIKRRGFSDEAVQAVKAAHRIVYRSGKKLSEAIAELDESRKEYPEVDVFVKSLESSDKGIIRGRG